LDTPTVPLPASHKLQICGGDPLFLFDMRSLAFRNGHDRVSPSAWNGGFKLYPSALSYTGPPSKPLIYAYFKAYC